MLKKVNIEKLKEKKHGDELIFSKKYRIIKRRNDVIKFAKEVYGDDLLIMAKRKYYKLDSMPGHHYPSGYYYEIFYINYRKFNFEVRSTLFAGSQRFHVPLEEFNKFALQFKEQMQSEGYIKIDLEQAIYLELYPYSKTNSQ